MRERWILVAAAVGLVLFGYPGLMSYDSVAQLDQARRWDLGDWHPPAMALVWRAVELVIAGPFGMLLLQVTAFVGGGYLLLRSSMSARAAAWTTLALCWYPPILTTMGVIWKDSQMAGYLLLGLAAIRSSRPRLRWLGVFVLVVASAMRHNAAAATFAPLLLLWDGSSEQARWHRVLVAAAVWVGITAAAFGLNSVLAQRSEHPWTRSVAVTDIVGIVRWSPPLSDEYLSRVLEGTRLKVTENIQAAMIDKYEVRGWLNYYQDAPPLELPESESEHAATAAAWKTLVLAQPGAYLRYRWQVFRRIVHLGGHAYVPPLTLTFYYAGDPSLDERIAHRASPSGLQRTVFRIVKKVGGILYVPYIYLVVSLVLVWLARRHRVELAMLASGIGYEASLFIAAPSPDFRYSHWLITTTLLAVAMMVARRSRTRT